MVGPKFKIGIVGRFFPIHYRPALEEIDFLTKNHFNAIQFNGIEEGISEEFLGASFSEINQVLINAAIQPTMELMIRVNTQGKNQTNQTITQFLKNNLNAIVKLNCNPVHIHIVPPRDLEATEQLQLLKICKSEFIIALDVAKENNFSLGIEHNDPEFPLFGNFSSCELLIPELPQLLFTWDINHTPPHEVKLFSQWFNRLAVVHVSDSPLPELNYHWSLGKGSIDFKTYLKPLIKINYSGIFILEVGGLPKSGGYGQDTDEALLHSKQYLEKVLHDLALST
jgi:L-ribulose-5-phosphate 3-epimerase